MCTVSRARILVCIAVLRGYSVLGSVLVESSSLAAHQIHGLSLAPVISPWMSIFSNPFHRWAEWYALRRRALLLQRARTPARVRAELWETLKIYRSGDAVRVQDRDQLLFFPTTLAAPIPRTPTRLGEMGTPKATPEIQFERERTIRRKVSRTSEGSDYTMWARLT